MSKRVLVCGGGSIGRRHIANLIRLGSDVLLWRVRSELLTEISNDFPVKIYKDLTNAIADADAVVIATSTDQHISIATKVLEAGKALFIEKPISHNWTGIDNLAHLALGKVIEVGFQFRTHPNLIALESKLKQTEHQRLLTYRLAMGYRLDAWRPTQDYKKSYSASAARGGGALFDLIHQIDIALWLFGPVISVQAILAKLSDLSIQGDDVTNILLTHKSGVTGHIQLDMVSPVNRCEAEVITSNAIFRWDNTLGKLLEVSSEGEIIVDSLPHEFQRNDLFYTHMKHWLSRIDDPNILPLCSFENGIEALKVALSARISDTSKKMIKIEDF